MENRTHFAVLTLEIFIPSSHSLKDKRTVIKSLKAKLRNKFNISVTESAYHEKWQRAQIVTAEVSTDKKYLDSSSQKIISFIEYQLTGYGELISQEIVIQ
ncbi:MAG: DUF503 domain-containing protein [Candidatus Marinimicrobia bacterium]|jgi:hypothetical protein|nr:DUF503 domain-containing protein [Candidatus Neomarinimicrobiota bacterium]MBT3632737.1 DUF503 domain-containing protein [Candidatus Neomarinimicrobiota bacterium]MBT3681847.1 DUF503 domain-containing protein [Candidatus Neomarinimicrobiota bacterium]MBT3760520.1 DUF503 domain-containing protein [Candidatus Neomarinimicrobiota bacterium]MBT3896666.1 DUF503 domain-containing protein [Candidatus Neomarinimicrobiota bacterium]